MVIERVVVERPGDAGRPRVGAVADEQAIDAGSLRESVIARSTYAASSGCCLRPPHTPSARFVTQSGPEVRST